MLIGGSRISSKYFYWQEDINSMTADISNLPGHPDLFKRIYDDAADAGFTMVSEKTGKEATFYYTHEDEMDGDIYGWNFKICPESACRFPHMKGMTVLVAND